jgi:putative membrane protein
MTTPRTSEINHPVDTTVRASDLDEQVRQDTPPAPASSVMRRSRVGSVRSALILSTVILVLLLIFILQNGHSVKVSFLGASGHMPLAVAMLFAAIAGALLIAIPGTIRIIQLRHGARRQHREDVQR